MQHLSYSSIALFYKNREEFYLKYIAEHRPPRLPQTRPMSIGSAFDARVKNFLHDRLFGHGHDPRFAFEAIFEAQVEEQNRDWALAESEYAFDAYRKSGALSDLMIELKQAVDDPRMEFRVMGDVKYESSFDGIPVVGYPDLLFRTSDGTTCVYDFKVNGYCAKSAVSPSKGYIKCRDGWDSSVAPPSRGGNGPHKSAQIMRVHDILINIGAKFEEVNDEWAKQTTLYGWLTGTEIGAPMILGIDQLACKPNNMRPLIRVASHRGMVSKDFQHQWYETIKKVWDTVQHGHIFDDLSREESDAKCQELETYHEAFTEETPEDIWFNKIIRQH